MVASYPQLPQQLPQTSSAVNIQIIEPKNFPGGAVPGQINNMGAQQPSFYPPAPTPYGSPYPGFQNPAQPQPQPQYPSQSQFQPQFPPAVNPYPTNYNNMFPAMDPRQALQNAYAEALNARSMAEQSRNAYLNMANQLNAAAPQQPPQQQYFPQAAQYSPSPFDNQNPFAFQPPQPQYYPQSNEPSPFQPQPAQYTPQPNGDFQPQGMMPSEPPPQPQSFNEPVLPPAPPPMPTLQTASVEDLNMMMDQPVSLQERIDAMEEVGVRGFGTAETYDLLQREALANTDHLEGQAKDDADYARQAALWTLGMLNRAQNAGVPTDSLPGLNAVEQILKDKRESPEVKAAAVQALQVINRPEDKRIKNILKKARKDKNPDVKALAEEALSGRGFPNPGVAFQFA